MAHRFSKEELDEQFEEFLKEVCLRATSHPYSLLKKGENYVWKNMKRKIQLCFYHIINIAVLCMGLCKVLIANLNSHYFAVLKSREQFCNEINTLSLPDCIFRKSPWFLIFVLVLLLVLLSTRSFKLMYN